MKTETQILEDKQKLIDLLIYDGLNDQVKITQLEDDQEMMLDINIKLKKELNRVSNLMHKYATSYAEKAYEIEDFKILRNSYKIQISGLEHEISQLKTRLYGQTNRADKSDKLYQDEKKHSSSIIATYNTFIVNMRSIPWYSKLFIRKRINTFLTDINKA